MLIGLILRASLSRRDISHDCIDARLEPKSVLHGQFQETIWENSVLFKHTSGYRRVHTTKNHKQPCTELIVWRRQNVPEYYADPYCLESQNLGTESFLIHIVAAEGPIGCEGLILGSQESNWEGGNLATLLTQHILSCTALTLPSYFRGIHPLPALPHTAKSGAGLWTGCNFITLKA